MFILKLKKNNNLSFMPKKKRIFSERTGPDFLCGATGLEKIDYKISNGIITAVIIKVKVVSVCV